jgi:hypothetical protein
MAWYDVYNYDPEEEKWAALRRAKTRYQHLAPFKTPETLQPGSGKQEQDEMQGGTSLNDPADISTGSNVYRIMEEMRDSDYLRKIDDDYVYNTHTIFKGLKMPNFEKVTKVKSNKPTPKQLANYAGMTGYAPLREGLKVYKYKTIDRETGESVIVPQKEITVYAENRDNYFYLEGGTLKSVAKDEVSPQEINKTRLEGMYKYNINKKAESVRKLPTPSQMKGQKIEPYEAGFMEKVKEAGKSVLGGFVYGVGEKLSGGASALADAMIAHGTGPYAHEDEYFGTYEMKLDEKTGMLKDPEEYDKWIADREKMEKHKFPKGYSKETDVMAKTTDKVAIALAREDDDKTYLADFLGKRKEDINAKEEYSKIAGNIAGTITELVATGKLTSAISAPKYIKKAIEVSVMAGNTGFLESLKKKDSTAIDHLKAFSREAAFFTLGGGAASQVEKKLAKVAIPSILKKGAKSVAFGLGGSVPSSAFVNKDERAEYILTQTLVGTAFDAGMGITKGAVKGASKGITKGISKATRRLLSTELDRKIDKELSVVVKEFGLDRDISKLTLKQRAELEEDVTRKLLSKVGKSVRDRIAASGTKSKLTPKSIVRHYANKYNIKGKLNVRGDLRGSGNIARVEIKGNNIEVKYNKQYSQDEIAGSIRHEIEHILDYRSGFKSNNLRVENPQTLAQMLAKPGHHSRANNFEVAYLENIIAKDTVESYMSSNASEQIRKRMGMEVQGLNTPLYREQIHNRNRAITEASNLPSYEPKQKTPKEKLKGVFDRTYRDWVDRFMGISQTGQKAKVAVTNYGKYHGQVDYNINTNLTDKAGNHIGKKSLRSVLEAPKGLQAEYESYLLHLHHLDRLNVKKPVLADAKGKLLSKNKTKAIIEQYEMQFPEFRQHKENLRQYWDDFMVEYAVDGDLVTKEAYNEMKKLYPEYVPTFRNLNVFPSSSTGGRVIKETPIKGATGSTRELLPLAETMPTQMQRIMRAQKRNRVYLSIVDQIITNPKGMQQYGQIDKKAKSLVKDRIKELTSGDIMTEALDSLDGQLIKTEKYGNYMVALDKGEPIPVKINDEFLWKALEKLNKQNISRPEELLRFFNNAVTQNFKKVTTVYNPLFAIRNAARDTPTAYIYGKVDNPLAFMKNLAGAYGDVFKKNSEYQKFVALGGQTSNITKADQHIKYKDAKTAFKIFDAVTRFVGKGLNYFGEVSETAPRLAEFKSSYKRYIKKGIGELDALEMAMYDAGEVTVNFARGGEVAKTADMVIPYFNAGIQGSDRFIRAMFTEGVKKGNWKPIIKSMGILTIPSMALHMVNKNINHIGYEELPDYVKDDNYVWPLSDTKYLKIPKNRENSLFFSTMFTRMFDFVVEGKEDAFEGFGEAVERALGSPIGDFAEGGILGPLINIVQGGNKDYFGRPIEPLRLQMEGRAPRDIFDERSSKLSVELGPYLEKMFNISPKQADYLIKSYGGIVGQLIIGWNYMSTPMSDTLERMTGFSVDTTYSSKSQQKLYEDLTETKREINRIEIDAGVKSIRNRMRGTEARQWEIDEAVESALGGRMTRIEALKKRRKDLERRIKGLPPE